LILLAFDTALESCGAAVLDGDRVLAARAEPMARGHQERLAPLVAELMQEAALPFSALERIGVTVGPGSFTGLRVGLAFAKGLGVALDRPVVGIGTLQAMAASEPADGLVVAAIDARRDQLYLQVFRDGVPASEPEALGAEAAAALVRARGEPVRLIGSGGPLLAPYFPAARSVERSGADPAALARLVAAAPAPDGPPRPLYLRAPDAKLPA